jgi:phospholipid/cholesterol/gamma-HCH transport system permease protein
MILKIFQISGRKTLLFFEEIGGIFLLLLEIIKLTPTLFKNRKLFFEQLEHIGVASLPLVTTIALFTGAVASLQAAYQLKGVAPLSFLGAATSRSIITELGPVLTAIVIAGRVGASMSAEIGSMKVTDQINALFAMGINPTRYLAVPRFYASLIMIPILVIFADAIAVLGSYVVGNYFLGVSFEVYFDSVKRFFAVKDFVFGISKGFLFGGVTSLIGTYLGFRTKGGAEGVGKSTINAFVEISAVILIIDALMWMFIN